LFVPGQCFEVMSVSILSTKDDNMQTDDALIAVFADHLAAEKAVKTLVDAGFSTKNLSVAGKGSQTGENTAFHGIGDRIKFWGTRGAFWGSLWGLFFGGLLVAFPEAGIVVVLGYLAATTISIVEREAMVDGLGTLAAALTAIGIPLASAAHYDAAVSADGFLVMVHGSSEEIERAKSLVAAEGASNIEVHAGLDKQERFTKKA
jgi:hypothetical protein